MTPQEFVIAVAAYCYLFDARPIGHGASAQRRSWALSFLERPGDRPLRAYVTYLQQSNARLRTTWARSLGLVISPSGNGDELTAFGHAQV